MVEDRFNSSRRAGDAGAAERLRERGAEAAHDLKERAAETIDSRVHQLAERFDAVASCVGMTGECLRKEREAEAAQIADYAADRIDGVGRYLREHDPAELGRDAADAMRRHPEITLGAAFVGGLLLARFLRSSSPREPSHRANLPSEELQAGFDRRTPPSSSRPSASAPRNAGGPDPVARSRFGDEHGRGGE